MRKINRSELTPTSRSGFLRPSPAITLLIKFGIELTLTNKHLFVLTTLYTPDVNHLIAAYYLQSKIKNEVVCKSVRNVFIYV
jgi:hypothetical protein